MLYTPTKLTDLSPHFKKWEDRRRESDTVTDVLRTGSVSHQSRADRIAKCSTFLELHPLDMPDGRQRWIAHTRRCRDRLCSTCQVGRMVWWKARCQAALRQLLTAHPDAAGIALTFTVRNCAISHLRDTLIGMSKAWAAMIRRPPWPEHYGWLRVTEVTRGDDGTAHPHYHVLLLVPDWRCCTDR
jgi:plasmid rolling circle replication initiator protein Rep